VIAVGKAEPRQRVHRAVPEWELCALLAERGEHGLVRHGAERENGFQPVHGRDLVD
jgi:hypothetical protein